MAQSSPTKKDRKHRGELVANTKKQEGNKPKQSRGGRGKFDEIMNKPCQNHGFLVNHLARDCQTYRREVTQQASKDKSKGGNLNKGKDRTDDDDQDGYPNVQGIMIIFRSPQGFKDCRREKVICHLIFTAAPTVPVYLKWLERPITFNRDDHPDHVVEAGRFLLVVSAIIEGMKMTKVLMDGGSSINILYNDAFQKPSVGAGKLCPSHSLFQGIVPGRRVTPHGTITLSIMFGDQVHYRKETLSVEVIDFNGPYYAILGMPCYAKFMVIPSYAYLKLKMPGPRGVITITGNF
ncbi:uncharacterized protein [Miscanthus floridulus]|uniref:uncharacterized protein n=1 Tax=Miscanthus floridulus TaxID=154761 RepID=UPI00345839EE